MPQLRLEQGWVVDIGAPWSPKAKSMGLGRQHGKLKPGPGASASEVATHQRDRIYDVMLGLVAERGYGGVTVRDIARRAGVSTRSFYQHYSGKEECFLAVHDRISGRILEALKASNQEPIGGQKTARAVTAISRELDRDPRATHLLLIDAYEAGAAAIDRSHRMTRSFESRVGEIEAPNIVARGILAGLTSVAQGRLLSGQTLCMRDMAGHHLVRWALAYFGGSMVDLEELSRASAGEVQSHWGKAVSSSAEMNSPISGGDRSLLVSAAEKLIKATGHDEITEKKLWTVAGIPRRTFEAIFSCLEDCLTLVLWQHIEAALARARKASREGSSPAGGVYRGVVALCREMAQDPVLGSLCFDDERFGTALRLRSHQEIKTQISRFVIESLAPSSDVEELSVDASVGAFWGVAEGEVRRGDSRSLSRMAVPLTYLILAPTIGPEQTIAAMRSELNHAAQKRTTHNNQGGKSHHAGKRIVAQAETAPTR